MVHNIGQSSERPQFLTLSSHSVVHSLLRLFVPFSLYYYKVQGYLAKSNTHHRCCITLVTTKRIHTTLIRVNQFLQSTLYIGAEYHCSELLYHRLTIYIGKATHVLVPSFHVRSKAHFLTSSCQAKLNLHWKGHTMSFSHLFTCAPKHTS